MSSSLSSPKELNRHVALFTSTRLVISSTCRMVYPFLAVFANNLHVDISKISLAIAFSMITSAAAPFIAPIADRRGRKTGMLLGVAIFLVGTLLAGLFPSYTTLFLLILLANLGNNIFLPSMQAYLGDRIVYEKRGFYLAITELSWALAFVLIVPFAGWIIEKTTWYLPFILLGALGFIMLLFIWRVIPADHPTEEPDGHLFKDFPKIFTSAPALLGMAFGLTCVAANEVVNVVFGVWIQTSYGIEIAALGAATLLIGISELCGEGVTAYLADHLGKQKSVALGLILNTLCALSLPLLSSSRTGAFIWLFIFYFTFEIEIISSLPLMTEVYPSGRATMMALFIAALSLGRALGDLIATPIYAHGIFSNALTAACFNVVALVALSLVRLPKRSIAVEEGQG